MKIKYFFRFVLISIGWAPIFGQNSERAKKNDVLGKWVLLPGEDIENEREVAVMQFELNPDNELRFLNAQKKKKEGRWYWKPEGQNVIEEYSSNTVLKTDADVFIVYSV